MGLGNTMRLGIALVAAGCGGSEATPSPSSDAQAPMDGGDASVDAPGTIDVATRAEAGLGAPCATDDQCQGSLCLGGAFPGGYCSSPVGECDPGSGTAWCGDGGECRKLGGTDVDGAAAGEYCLQLCQAASDCRSGYACCQAQEYPEGDAEVCAPPSFCRDQ
jgi:hypothetical protein